MKQGEEINGGLVIGEFEKHYIVLSPAAGETNDTWENSVNFCTNLVIGEFSDWVLPSAAELLFVCNQQANFIDGYVLQDGYYWSSTVDRENDACAITQALYAKIAGYQVPLNKTNIHYARAICKIPV